MSTTPWSVLHVVAHHEKRVAQHLDARSLTHYLPLYTERSRWSDRSVIVERPLFTGYVFIRFTPQERLAVISTPGVIRLLGDHPSEMVSAEEIDKIREGLRSGYLLRPHPVVSVGTHVRVRVGVFSGVEGVVTELRPQCKVILRLAAIRQCFSLQLDLDQIELIQPPITGTAQRPAFAR